MPNFVARKTSSRRPAIARPTSCSLVYGPYMSAVSSMVTPSSSARWIVRDRLRLVARAVELGHAHAAEAEGGDGRAVRPEDARVRMAAYGSRRLDGRLRCRDRRRARHPWPGQDATTTASLALDDLDLSVADGDFFGLLGPNGAGKTTLISAVCNLIRVTAGEICASSATRTTTLAARRLIGLAEQDVNLDRFLDVEETLRLPRRLLRHDRAAARRRARAR